MSNSIQQGAHPEWSTSDRSGPNVDGVEPRVDMPSDDGLITRLRTLLQGRWSWAIVLGLALCAVAGFFGWKIGQRIYVSHGEIHVAPFVDDYGLSDPSDRAGLNQNYDALLDTQTQYLKSMRVIDKAMNSDGWRSQHRGYSNIKVAEFVKNLQVSHKGEIIFVEMHDSDPDAAMAGARSVVGAYQALTAEEDAERGREKLEFLRSELARASSSLVDIDASIAAKMREQGFADLGPDDLIVVFESRLADSTTLNGRLKDVRRELALGESAQKQAGPTTHAAAIRSLVDSEPSAAEIAVQNSQMASLLARQRDLEDRRQMMLSKYGPENPLVKSTESELVRIAEDVTDFRDSFRAWELRQHGLGTDPLERQKLVRLEASLQESVVEAGNAVDKVARLKRDIYEFRERADAERKNRDEVKRRLEAQERVTRIPGRVRVLEAADKPLEPDSDTRPRLAVAGGILGLVGGVSFVALAGLLDYRVRSPEDARRVGVLAGRPVLGLLPDLPDELEDPDQAARSVHQVRTHLQLWYGGMSRPAFAIAGPASGSGKTTLTLALGLSYAAARSRTLLIDFDFIGGGLTQRVNAIKRRRLGAILKEQHQLTEDHMQEGLQDAAHSNIRLGEALVKLGHLSELELSAALLQQQKNTLGVVNVLTGDKLADCVFQSDVSDLSILPLGNAGAHHVGSISPLGFQQLVDAARKEFDVVLIDTGPLPGSLEGAAAVAAADGVVLTVSRGDSRAGLRHCERYLESIGARLAGIVFNRATARQFISASGSSSSQPSRASRSSAIPSELASRRFGPFGEAVAHASQPGKNVSVR